MFDVNINVSNLERSKAFYEALGFRVVWTVPPTNSKEVAAAVGMPPHRVNGGLMALKGSAHPLVIGRSINSRVLNSGGRAQRT